jgi:hypothetical protein
LFKALSSTVFLLISRLLCDLQGAGSFCSCKCTGNLVEPIAVCLAVCLAICLSVCLSVCLSGCLAVWLSGCLAVWLSVWLSVCLSKAGYRPLSVRHNTSRTAMFINHPVGMSHQRQLRNGVRMTQHFSQGPLKPVVRFFYNSRTIHAAECCHCILLNVGTGETCTSLSHALARPSRRPSQFLPLYSSFGDDSSSFARRGRLRGCRKKI